MTGLSDSFQRPINYLRLSVTDRCNLRCIYCMPEGGVACMPHKELLSYEEIFRIVHSAADMGITKVRITGGEPLVRAGLPKLIKMISNIETIDDIALTTNGILLPRFAAELKEAGLGRVNISLDTLKPGKFLAITRSRGTLQEVFKGIEAAKAAGLTPVKLNMVVIAGMNDDEIVDFGRKTIEEEWHVRFIEHMPLASESVNAKFVSVSEMRKRLAPLGELEPCHTSVGNGPAKYFRLPNAKGTIGFITPVSEHFCVNCNRLRLTSDGKLRPCLLAEDEIDLKKPLRDGISSEELKKLIEQAVAQKPCRHHLGEQQVSKNHRPMSQVGG